MKKPFLCILLCLLAWQPIYAQSDYAILFDSTFSQHDPLDSTTIFIKDRAGLAGCASRFLSPSSRRNASIPHTLPYTRIFASGDTFAYAFWIRINTPQTAEILTLLYPHGVCKAGFKDLINYKDDSLVLGSNKLKLKHNAWNHIVCNIVGNQGELYLNDSLISSDFGLNLPVREQPQCIVPFNTNMLASFTGDLDDFMIYNKPLSKEEITRLYNGPTSCEMTNNPLAIEDGLLKEEVKALIVPNPSFGTFSITNTSELIEIKLYNMKGVLIRRTTNSVIDQQEPGVYLAEIEYKTHRKQEKVIVY